MTENNTTHRVLCTGDIHGSHSIRKLSSHSFKYNNLDPPLTKDDYLIICGDFGLLWYPENSELDKQDRYWLNWLDDKPWTTLFVDGNHENFERLNSYPVEEWNGGKIHRIKDSVIHLMRGQVFTLGNKTFACIGGGKSHDIEYRIEGRSWWPEEIPSQEERDEAIANLEKHNWKVDYVITHDTPTSCANRLIHTPDRHPNEYTDWLEKEIANKLEFNQWFFGHYHQDRELFDGKFQCMYHDVTQIL